MRNREEVDNLSVHTRAIKAAGRIGANGNAQVIEHNPELATAREVVGLPNLLRGALELTTRTNSGQPAVIRVPHSILAVLVTITLALIGGGYWIVSTITRIDTKMDTVTRQQDKIDRYLETQKAYIDAETNQVRYMQGLMTRDQQKSLDEYQRTHRMPSIPSLPEQEN